MGQKGAKFSVWSFIVEKIFFCPPLPPLCDPKLYPSPRAILGGTSLFEAFSPPLWKKVGAHVCLQYIAYRPFLSSQRKENSREKEALT